MKNLDFINESHFTVDETHFQEVLDILIHHNFLEENQTLCLKLIDEGEIKDYNKRYRGKDKATDVLTFPSEFKESGFLGDILIDVWVANRQKETRSLIEELHILFIHGILHLLGYDHLRTNDKNRMEQMETNIKDLLTKEKSISWK